jgi:hypothetical protein
MSSMRDLLEKMNQFAGEKAGQKPGDQVRGSEPMPKKGGGKKHPYAGRLVGANESSGNLLKELDTVINSNPVKRDLFQEWSEFNEGFEDTVKLSADKIAAAGSATRDALGTAINSIPRPFDEVEVAKSIKQGQREQIRKDVKDVSGNYGKEQQRQTTPISPQQKAGIRQAVNDYNQVPKKQSVDEDQGPYIPPDERRSYMSDTPISEWGAAGTAVGPGNDDADPVEIAAQRAQQVAGKQDQQNQLAGLIDQVNGARSQLADLNKQFPQGANPVEKAMSLQQQQAQRVQLGRQIEDLMSQVAGLRSQA